MRQEVGWCGEYHVNTILPLRPVSCLAADLYVPLGLTKPLTGSARVSHLRALRDDSQANCNQKTYPKYK